MIMSIKEKLENLDKEKTCNAIIYYFMIYFLGRAFFDMYFFEIFKYITMILIVAGEVLYCYENRVWELKGKAPYKKMIFGLIVAYCIYIVLNGIIMMPIEAVLKGVKEHIIFPGMLFASLYYIKNSRLKFEDLQKFLIHAGILISLISIYEFAFNRLFLPIEIDMEESYTYGLWVEDEFIIRSRALAGSFLTNGVIEGILVLCTLQYNRKEKSRKYWIIFALHFFALMCTASRGPLVATLAGAVFIFGWDEIKEKKLVNRYKRLDIYTKTIIIASVVAVAGIAVLIAITTFETGIDTLDYFIDRYRSIFVWDSSEIANNQRKNIWFDSLEMFIKRPVFGYGICYTGAGDMGSISMGATESGVLKRLVEFGAIGFILYYSLVAIFIWLLLERMYKSKKTSRIAVLATSIVLLVLLEDVILQATEGFIVSFFLWFFAAVAWYFSGKRKNSTDGRVES